MPEGCTSTNCWTKSLGSTKGSDQSDSCQTMALGHIQRYNFSNQGWLSEWRTMQKYIIKLNYINGSDFSGWSCTWVVYVAPHFALKTCTEKGNTNTWSHKNSKLTGHPHPKPSLHDPYGPSYSSLPTRAWAARHQLPDSLISVSFILRLHWCQNKHHWQPGSLMTGSLFHGILKSSPT